MNVWPKQIATANRRYASPICLGGLAVVAAIAGWKLMEVKPPLTLNIRNFSTNQWPDAIAKARASRDCIRATVEVTNASNRSITYWVRPSDNSLRYRLKCDDGTVVATHEADAVSGTQRFDGRDLAPSQMVTFEAVIDTFKPCRIELFYWDRTAEPHLFDYVPSWIVSRLPGASRESTVSTRAIHQQSAKQ